MLTTYLLLVCFATGEDVEGFGRDATQARQQARERASDVVRMMLAEKFGANVGADVSPDFLEKHRVIVERSAPEPAGDRILKARYHVELTPSYLRAIKAGQRQGVLLRVLLALMLVFAVSCGYLRIDDWTRGYATRLLRVSAAIIFLLAGLILWLTW